MGVKVGKCCPIIGGRRAEKWVDATICSPLDKNTSKCSKTEYKAVSLWTYTGEMNALVTMRSMDF